MNDQVRSWFRDNQSTVVFLIAQTLALIAGGVTLITYAVKLETRVAILETRGAPYTVERLGDMDERLTILEQGIATNNAQLKRIVDILTDERK